MSGFNSKLRQKKILQNELEKNTAELDQYRKEPTSYFAYGAELLDNTAKDYRQLYQDTTNSPSGLLAGYRPEENPSLQYRLTGSEVDNDQVSVEIGLRSYSKSARDLRRKCAMQESELSSRS